jgi:soluble lytic murein transglycosylase-like protein
MRKGKAYGILLALTLVILTMQSGSMVLANIHQKQVETRAMQMHQGKILLLQMTQLEHQMAIAVALQEKAVIHHKQSVVLTRLQKYTGLSYRVVSLIVSDARASKIPPSIVVGLMQAESTFDPHAFSGSSLGLGQINANTAPMLASRSGMTFGYAGQLYDPAYNTKLTVEYLSLLYAKFHDWDATLTAYNRGIGGYESWVREYGTPRSQYSEEVLYDASIVAKVTGVK